MYQRNNNYLPSVRKGGRAVAARDLPRARASQVAVLVARFLVRHLASELAPSHRAPSPFLVFAGPRRSLRRILRSSTSWTPLCVSSRAGWPSLVVDARRVGTQSSTNRTPLLASSQVRWRAPSYRRDGRRHFSPRVLRSSTYRTPLRSSSIAHWRALSCRRDARRHSSPCVPGLQPAGRHCSPVCQLTRSRASTCIVFRAARWARFAIIASNSIQPYAHYRVQWY